ncbi:MAG: D-glycero-beta-D-manno-heptose 1-phosphate adenylyltransferase [Pseudomonadota bacterium]|nr:D-glycero-beta-D-manno-heptose 1-phosphate adenylyltransferase [Pseudomonadota bacterium]
MCQYIRWGFKSSDTIRVYRLTPSVSFEHKIFSPNNLRQLPRPLVFTNGCFDILHRGHVTYLAQAKNIGVALIVAVNSDASIKRLNKGTDRPINKLEDRLSMLAALESVDAVTWFDSDTPLDLILKFRPDFLVKGGDWQPEQIVGAKEVISWGGQVHSIPFLFDRSTTSILARIRQLPK